MTYSLIWKLKTAARTGGVGVGFKSVMISGGHGINKNTTNIVYHTVHIITQFTVFKGMQMTPSTKVFKNYTKVFQPSTFLYYSDSNILSSHTSSASQHNPNSHPNTSNVRSPSMNCNYKTDNSKHSVLSEQASHKLLSQHNHRLTFSGRPSVHPPLSAGTPSRSSSCAPVPGSSDGEGKRTSSPQWRILVKLPAPGPWRNCDALHTRFN